MSASTQVDLTIHADERPDLTEEPPDVMRRAAATIRGRLAGACDLDQNCGDVHRLDCEALEPLAALLTATADRWDRDVTLDRPDTPENTLPAPYAWWCDRCQGAVASKHYPSDDQRCLCGVWEEALALALGVLARSPAVPA